MAKKLDPIKTWNGVVEALLSTRAAWEDHKEVMQTRPKLELLPIEAQHQLRFIAHNAPTFEKFLDAFMQRWQTSGGLDSLLIDTKAIEKREKQEQEVAEKKTKAKAKAKANKKLEEILED